jgi:hypothetical protein
MGISRAKEENKNKRDYLTRAIAIGMTPLNDEELTDFLERMRNAGVYPMFFKEIPVSFTEILSIGLKIKEIIVDNAVIIRASIPTNILLDTLPPALDLQCSHISTTTSYTDKHRLCTG